MALRLTHLLDEAVELRHDGALLCRYVYAPDLSARESPMPYFHPLRTLAGDEVTLFRPHDHPWHKGLALTCAQLSGQNFWGGPTYVRDQGYVQLPNNGRVVHRGWRALACDGERASLAEDLVWLTADGEPWLTEERRIAVAEIVPSEGRWSLDLDFRLTNVAARPLAFGSPTTAGRPGAGYGGLFWRGPRSFGGGRILGGGDLTGEEIMGRRAPWLAYSGRHDGVDRASTLIFLDGPGNPRHPTAWFVRATSYVGVSAAFMFDQEYPLLPGAVLALRYRLVLAEGMWTATRIEELAGRYRRDAAPDPGPGIRDGETPNDTGVGGMP